MINKKRDISNKVLPLSRTFKKKGISINVFKGVEGGMCPPEINAIEKAARINFLVAFILFIIIWIFTCHAIFIIFTRT